MKSKGFTLIEIIVSLGIFSIVAVIAIGALVRVTSANRQAQAIQSGINNISFIMDSMSRELRTGKTYTCAYGSDLLNLSTGVLKSPGLAPICGGTMKDKSFGDVLITFESSNYENADPTKGNLLYAYLFHIPSGGATTTIYKAQATQASQTISSTDLIFYPLTSQSVNITDYKVGVFGGDNIHPYGWIYTRLKGYVGIQVKDQSVFDVQMSISQRNSTN